MKKCHKIMPILLIPLVASCGVDFNSLFPSTSGYSSETSGDDSSQSVSSEESTDDSEISIDIPSISVDLENRWDEEISYQMMVIIGEELPYIYSFGTSQEYEIGYEDSSRTIPYIASSIDNPGYNLSILYAAKALYEGYLPSSSEEDEDGINWYCYRKDLIDQNESPYIELRFAYYEEYEDSYVFTISAHRSTAGGGLPIPTSASYALNPNDCPSSYVAPSSITINNMSCILSYIMKSNSKIWFKRNSGQFYNSSGASSPIKYLYLKGYSSLSNFSLLAGNSRSSLKTLPSYNGVFLLSGYSYFQVSAGNSDVSVSAIWFINE
ncbi:MAG: hypothetical protein WC366_00355 [Bacilli bacterium]|jgi:hypothetical protein